tara:strand:+ start:530 stop:1252 length:723 start_codon:yes stop_codon:yes gene_type:complete
MKNKQSIYFATPCYGGNINALTTLSFISLFDELNKRDIPFKIDFLIDSSLVTKARNILVNKFMENDEYTHLMFIDADTNFDTWHFIQMLEADKELIGAPYPRKTIHWQKIYDKKNEFSSINEMVSNSTFYIPPYFKNKKDDSIQKIDFLGTGFMLIKKSVFIKIMEKEPDKFYKPDYNIDNFRFKNKKHYMFFENGIVDGIYRGEDYHFCEKWRKMGGDCWVLHTKKSLGHVGSHNFIKP